MELSSVQKEILSALISLYRRNSRSIRGEEIAEVLGRNPGTIRNQMQSLKALKLVEGVPGPKGGYKATSAAYRELQLDTLAEEAHVVLVKNGAEVNDGDLLKLGPTPVNRLTIKGTVCGRNDAENTVIILVSEMVSPPKAPISEYASTSLITIDINAPLQQVAKILNKNNIHGAPVMGNSRLVGMVTLTDLGKAIATGNFGSAGDIMNQNVFTVEEDKPVYEAMRLFTEYSVGRLIVTAKGSPKGIITQSDVLRKISTL